MKVNEIRELTLEERRRIQLEMLREFDVFCRKNNLKYSLAYGTLLGAIRHKGFIPWDDDVDIMMPLNDMQKMRSLLKSDLIEYCDVDICKYFNYGFSRLAHKGSFSKPGMIVKSYGVPIDLYPIYNIPDNEIERDKYFNKVNKILKVRLSIIKWRGRIIRAFPVKTIPLHTYFVRKYRDVCQQYGYTPSNTSYICSGMAQYRKNILRKDVFEKVVDVDFEGEKFMSIADYDYFLTNRYGNYMQLPPEEDRHPQHGGHFYWKEK